MPSISSDFFITTKRATTSTCPMGTEDANRLQDPTTANGYLQTPGSIRQELQAVPIRCPAKPGTHHPAISNPRSLQTKIRR